MSRVMSKQRLREAVLTFAVVGYVLYGANKSGFKNEAYGVVCPDQMEENVQPLVGWSEYVEVL